MLYYPFFKIGDTAILEVSVAVSNNKHAASRPLAAALWASSPEKCDFDSPPNLFIAALVETAGNHRYAGWKLSGVIKCGTALPRNIALQSEGARW